jgi:hypothetical protein
MQRETLIHFQLKNITPIHTSWYFIFGKTIRTMAISEQ